MTAQEITRRLRGHVPALMGARKNHAVLVPLVESGEGVSLLFEVRAQTLERQPGEVCFPGGRIELGETPAECALRETWEELGIRPESVEVVAELDFLCQQSGTALLYPVLGRVEAAALAGMDLNRAEVEEVFTVPLDFFLTTEPTVYTYDMLPQVGEDFPYELIGFPGGYDWRKGKGEVPIYSWQGRAIWGLTGRVARHLAETLR